MKKLKLFGCQDFVTGGKIVSIISLLENLVKIVVSVVFLVWAENGVVSEVMNRGGWTFLRVQRQKNSWNFRKVSTNQFLTISIFSTEISSAKIYAYIGIVGVFVSVLLLIGISKKCYKRFLPWICFQLLNIAYQVYFATEVIKSNRSELPHYSSLFILTIVIFHTIFECYYLCLIIALSQFIANLDVIGKNDVEIANFRDLPLKTIEFNEIKSADQTENKKLKPNRHFFMFLTAIKTACLEIPKEKKCNVERVLHFYAPK